MLIEFKCQFCDKTFELILRRKDKNKKQRCPDCNQKCKPVEYSRSSFDLKGSGWYKAGIS